MSVLKCDDCGCLYLRRHQEQCHLCGAFSEQNMQPNQSTHGFHLDSSKIRCVNCGFPSTSIDSECLKCKRPVDKKIEPKSVSTLCGCKRHQIVLGSDKLVHYQGNWWELRCLFFKVDKRMPKVIKKYQAMEREVAEARKMRIKFITMKNFMRKLSCDRCGHPAGNRFVQKGDSIQCGGCAKSKEPTC